MNERILELAEHAGLETSIVYGKPESIQKFAELLVKECARLSYLEDSGNPEVEAALEFWRQQMLKHFGVE